MQRDMRFESLERREMLAVDVFDVEADALTRSGAYANQNFGTDTVLMTKYQSPENDYNRESFLRFDLSEFDSEDDITAATVRLYVDNVGVSSINNHLAAVSNDTWTETSITWNNKPSLGSTLDSVAVTGAGWIEFDITSHVVNRTDDLLSLAVFSQTDLGGPGFVFYTSREHSGGNGPELRITTNSEAAGWHS